MQTIHNLRKKYHRLIAPLDLELLFSFAINKKREFILAHPEHNILVAHNSQLDKLIQRRVKGEPMAYILGEKEFYGLNFKVDKSTLIPRPETELVVELALSELRNLLRNKLRSVNVIDVGTGSGNIIISIASQLMNQESGIRNYAFCGTDISSKALLIAKYNAKKHKLEKKIKFLKGHLLNAVPKSYKLKVKSWIILANLPYLSSKIYASAPKDVKDYEPKSALWSPQNGLNHYIKLLQQIKLLISSYGWSLPADKAGVTSYLEISPEQKPLLQKMVKKILPSAKIIFHKDLAGKWRVCQIEI